MQNTKFKNRSDFYEQMKLTSLNDDPIGMLSNVYDDEYPHPVFDPEQICFRSYRIPDHTKYADRLSIKRNVRTVFQDIEMYIPGIGDTFHNLMAEGSQNPLSEQDFVVTSCVTNKDHLWPVPYVYNNYHFVKTHMANRNKKILRPETRPFFADVLFGNEKPHRRLFFDLMKQNNMLEGSIINLFHRYKSKFLESVTDDTQREMDTIQKGQGYLNTTTFLGNNFVSQHISKPIMENSWISVVSETLPDNDCFFLTEKTAKPLMAGRPFIMLGGVNYLKQLRQQGFKTFAPVIDESYDEIQDLESRVISAFESFRELARQDANEVTRKLLPALRHNQKIMHSKSALTSRARHFLDDLYTKFAYKRNTTT